jgi:nitrite reductase/ring-hydroxylating ferredoxin subunit
VSDGEAGHTLCCLEDIPVDGDKGFTLGTRSLFVVRTADGVFGYENVCPHQGTPLDWMPDRFLTLDKTLIQCATHGAQFQIEDGHCVAGPCVGADLQKVPLTLVDGVLSIGGEMQ